MAKLVHDCTPLRRLVYPLQSTVSIPVVKRKVRLNCDNTRTPLLEALHSGPLAGHLGVCSELHSLGYSNNRMQQPANSCPSSSLSTLAQGRKLVRGRPEVEAGHAHVAVSGRRHAGGTKWRPAVQDSEREAVRDGITQDVPHARQHRVTVGCMAHEDTAVQCNHRARQVPARRLRPAASPWCKNLATRRLIQARCSAQPP